ncbi:patatin-like protein [Citrobacter sp. Awk 4]|uniref:patatin-like protein n=1 Tax=Citrobacter sp. Awk 4 TaxID=2963955 RepID=UPI0023033B99|nr:patatin-like protein [Citrobacter sp. Awk 4]MDA8481229.1 patatin-like protein [Citrobacter sp. Awk 4]
MEQDYGSEVRLGVVMYGGVSLAIYINGVANELYELACSTPRKGHNAPSDGTATRAIYAALAKLVANPEAAADYAAALAVANALPSGPQKDNALAIADQLLEEHCSEDPTRFVIDVVSGTSAGGINGLFLARALANGEPFKPLKDLWITEGDIRKLINDQQSYKDTNILHQSAAEPRSLLNSDRMYVKLLEAMEQMTLKKPLVTSPYVEQMDLYVTTTDIRGSKVPIRLFDQVVNEYRYWHVFHFRYDDEDPHNDLAPAHSPFLAFAARCTSSFPFAFEPMTLGAAQLLWSGNANAATWQHHFCKLTPDPDDPEYLNRAFGDGGYLDNKPFGYAIEALSSRQGQLPMERKLIYIEPAPENISQMNVKKSQPTPNAIENALAAVIGLPRYETIREDVEAAIKRNRRIERFERIVLQADKDFNVASGDTFDEVQLRPDGSLPKWSELTLNELCNYYGRSYLSYRRLRVFAATDALADRLAVMWGVDRDSDHLYAFRALVRAWRETHFQENPVRPHRTVSEFLTLYDLEYRIRRTELLMRKVDHLIRLTRKLRRTKNASLSELDDTMITRLNQSHLVLLQPDNNESLSRLIEALQEIRLSLEKTHRALRRILRDDELEPVPLTPRDRSQLNDLLSALLERPERDPELDLQVGKTAIPVPLLKPTDRPDLPDLYRPASPTRTMQEMIFARATRLFELSSNAGETRLQHHLTASIENLRGRIEQVLDDSSTGVASEWQALGAPKLVVIHNGAPQIIMETSDPGPAALGTPEGKVLRKLLGTYFLKFEIYDQMTFPLYYGTDTGEPATVEVVRISPCDARSLIDETHNGSRRKLAGTQLFNFGAFIEERWRRNDIMWGRLDGAERLLSALLPGDGALENAREQLLRRAHQAIVFEELTPEGHAQLTSLFCDALCEIGAGSSIDDPVRSLVDRLQPGSPQERRRLQELLVSLMDRPGLVDHLQRTYQFDPNFNVPCAMESAARAVKVTGRLLKGISKDNKSVSVPAFWLARVGLLLQGLVAVSLPGSMGRLWVHHALIVLYAFLLVALAFTILLGDGDSRLTVIAALLLTVTFHIAMLVIGNLALRSVRIVIWTLGTALAVVLAFAVYGGYRFWMDYLASIFA